MKNSSIELGKDMRFFYSSIWMESSHIDEVVKPPRKRDEYNLDFHQFFWSIAWQRPFTLVLDQLYKDGKCD